LTLQTNAQPKLNIFLLLARFRQVGISFFIILLVIAVSIRSPYFLTFGNFRDIFLNISILSIVALAQTMVIITRGIDLSVSSMIGLVAMMAAFFIKANPDTPLVFMVLLMAWF
jgi:ribose/xylose/arabinose/galactoside ABC-type transport system permease subunit